MEYYLIKAWHIPERGYPYVLSFFRASGYSLKKLKKGLEVKSFNAQTENAWLNLKIQSSLLWISLARCDHWQKVVTTGAADIETLSNAMAGAFFWGQKAKTLPFPASLLAMGPYCVQWDGTERKAFWKEWTAGKLFWALFRFLLLSLLSAWKLMGGWTRSSHFVTIREKPHNMGEDVEDAERFRTLWIRRFSPGLPASEFIVT